MNKFFLTTSMTSLVTLIFSVIGSAHPPVNYSLVKQTQIQVPQGFTRNQGGVKQDFILAQSSKAEADKLFQQAEQQFRQAECPKALQTYQQVLEIRRQLGDKSEITQTLNKLAEVYSCSSKYPEALKVLEEALKIGKELRNSQIQGETTHLIGQVYSGQQEYPKALETLQQALILRQEAKDSVGEARTLANIGSVYLNLNQPAKALEILQKALKIQQSIKDNFHEAETLAWLGSAYFRSGKQEQSLDLLAQGLTWSQKVGHRLAEGSILFISGFVYFEMGKLDQAMVNMESGLPIIRQTKNKSVESLFLALMLRIYQEQGKYQKVLDIGKELLAVARERNNRPLERQILSIIAAEFQAQGQSASALEYFQQALVLAQELKQRDEEGEILFHIAGVNYGLGQYPKALELLKQALSVVQLPDASQQEKQKLRKIEAEIFNQLGKVYQKFGEYPEALKNFQQALFIARELKDLKLQQDILRDIGVFYAADRQYEKAISSHEAALKIADNYQDKGMILQSLAFTYEKFGQREKAIEIYQQALAVYPKGKEPLAESNILNNMGLNYRYLGQQSKALELLQKSLDIQIQIKNEPWQANTLNNIGALYQSLSQYQKALEYFQQVLKISQKIKNTAKSETSLNNLGAVYESLGQYQQAINYYRQALEINKKIKNRSGEAVNINNIGNVYLAAQQYQKALDYYQEALAISKEIKDPKGQSTNINNIGMVYDELEQYQKALEYYQRALVFNQKLKNRYEEAVNLSNIGGIYDSLKQYDKALKFHQQAFVTAKEINNLYLQGSAEKNIGTTYLLSGNPIIAEKPLYEAVDIWESLRGGGLEDENKITLFQNQFYTYQTLQKVLIALNKPEAALEIAERGRARAFVELLASKLWDKEEKLEVIKAPNIEQIKEIARQKKATIVQYSIVQDEVKAQGKYRERDLYIWIVKPNGEVAFRQVDLAKFLLQQQNTSLKDLVTITRDSVGVRSIFQRTVRQPEENPTKRLQQLHELLIAPISNLLPTDPNQRVIFVPQGGLFLVPFPALQDARGKYLIEKHTILTSPSIQVLELTQKQRERVQQISAQDAIVVGNPTMPKLPPEYGEGELTPLAGAKKEAEVIAHMLNTKALIGKEATETAVKAKLSRAKIIHLATHGLFDDIQGLRSALALAPSEKDNGLLTAEEILDQKLDADLVVLSACDTARGRITGDGVIGLSRSLISAGTPSVVVSLWAVPDAPTAELMKEFYTNMFEKKLDKAQALRQAMLKFKNKSPKNWAAFTLIGEAEQAR